MTLRRLDAASPVHPGLRLNAYYTAASVIPSTGAAAVAANLMYYQPIQLVGSVNRIGLEVTSGAAGNARIGLYSNADGVPGTLIVDGGALDTTSIAIVSATIDVTLRGEWVWLACVFDATPTCRNGAVAPSMIMGAAGGPSVPVRGVTAAFNYAALPASAPAWTSTATATPTMFLRRV